MFSGREDGMENPKLNPDISPAVIKMINFIGSHLKENITLMDIARAAGYSQFHALRIFKEETGLSPFEYLRKERLLKSAYELRSNTDKKVIEVAFDFVFDSHEGFTRAFSNAFGITPKKFASYNRNEGWLIPYNYLDRNRLKEEKPMENKTSFIFTQIVERPKRKLIVKFSKKATHYFEYCEEVGCYTPEKPDPWHILSQIKEALGEPMGVWLPDCLRPEGTGVYAHAIEVPENFTGKVPEGFDIIDLQPCKYLIFQGEPYDDDNYEEAIDALMDSISKFNPNVYGYEWDDKIAPCFQLEPMGWRGYIEGRPIREIKR